MKTKSGFDWPFFLKHIAIIAAPMALQNLLTTTGSMVDTMMLASLGGGDRGGRGPVRPVLQPDVRGVQGLRGRGVLFFAQYWGAGDEEGITRSYGLPLSFMMAVGILFAGLALSAPEFVMAIYTDKEEIRRIGVTYLRVGALPIRCRSWSWP